MADSLSLAVLTMTTSLAGLVVRGAAVAVDPSWSSAASLPGDTLNAWRSVWGLLQGRGGEENPLEASIKSRLQKQVDIASERHELAGVSRSALAGAATEMEVALKELSGDDAAVLEAVRFPDNFETYLRRQTAGRRRYVETAAESFFDDLTRIVAEEFIHLAPGSRGFDIAARKQLLAGQEKLSDQHKKTHERLDKIADSIDNIQSTSAQLHTVPKRIRFGSRPRVTTGFVKREGQDELFDAIFTHAEPRTVLTGMLGSGKTQLAAAVAAKCEDEGWPMVAWINAASRTELVADLYELALRIGIDAPKDVPPETIIQRFLDQLRSSDAANCLFVFDNVENLDDLKDLTPEGNGIRVTITTTRHLDWDSLGWLPLTVGVFDREQSITLLCGRTGDAHRDAADRIADALGDLPVAVTQAAATAKSGRYSLSNYLERLSNHPLESSISRLEGDDYPDAVGVALFIAYEQVLERLSTEHPQQERIAISLLDTLSLLSTSGVPTHWLLKLDDDSNAARDTLTFLKRSSIFQESANGDKTIIHRLQGQVYRETHLSNQEKFSEALTYTTTVLNKVKIESLDNFEEQRQEVQNLVEQVRSVTSQDYSYPLFSDPAFVFTLTTTLYYATNLGMPQLALTLTESVTQTCDVLGPNHPGTLASRNNLARAYQDAGRIDEAIPLYKQNLTDTENLMGPIHPHTLTARNNLAQAYHDAGRFQDGLVLHEQILEDSTRKLGPDHPITLRSRNNLAGAYRETGRLDEAITLYEQILEDSTRNLGPDHPDTLILRSNLAGAYQASGRLDEAIPLFEQHLEDSNRILSPDHPHTLTSRNSLARAYQASGRLDEAIPLYEQTLEDSNRIFGPSAPMTLVSHIYLASAYQNAGRLNEAITLHEQNLEDLTRILGPNHPGTLQARNNLASAYQDAGRLDEAITLYQQTLIDRTRILGRNHHSTRVSRKILAYTFQKAGKLGEAIALYEEIFEEYEASLGPNHFQTRTLREQLVAVFNQAFLGLV